MLIIEEPRVVLALFAVALLLHLYGKRWCQPVLRSVLVSRDKRNAFELRRAEIVEMKQNLVKFYCPSTFDKYALEKRKLNKTVAEQTALGEQLTRA